MDMPWIFNNYINQIPYESEDHDFDGVCIATAVKATKVILFVPTTTVLIDSYILRYKMLRQNFKLFFLCFRVGPLINMYSSKRYIC